MYINRYCLAKHFLKVSKSKFLIFKLFQSHIVVGIKEWLYWFVLAYAVDASALEDDWTLYGL